MGRSYKFPFSCLVTVYSSHFELVHSDIWGLSPHSSINGHRYYIHFIDTILGFTWLYPLHTKSQAYQVFIDIHKMVELQFNCKIKALQSDVGIEFVKIGKYLKDHGILPHISCPYTHEQNGLDE